MITLPLSSPAYNFTTALNYFSSLNNNMATADLKAMDQVHLGGNGHGNGNGNDYTDHTTSPQSTTSTNSNSNNSKNGHKVTYEDPDADVSLRSSDGRIFKVESYVLKTHR
jgi:hypothetical protein